MIPNEIKILVVDDNADITRITARLLEQAGYSVAIASTGAEALHALQSFAPSLVLLDRDMPGMDGLEVCRRIKADPAYNHVFVVLISCTHTTSEEQSDGLDSGADGYIASPIANRELVARVSAFVRILRLNQSLRKSEMAMAHSQAELKAIYDHSPVMMCVVDQSRQVLYANAAFTTFTGKVEDDLIGGHACGVFGCINALDDPRGCGFGPKCAQCALRLAMEDTFRTGIGHQNLDHLATLIHDGNHRDVALLASTALIHAGDHNRLLLCLTDITTRKHAEEDLRQTRAILEAAMDQSTAGIAIADAPSGRLRYVNDAGLLIRGGDRQAVVNDVAIDQYVASWNILDLDGRPLAMEEVPLTRAILFGETCSREFIIRRDHNDDRAILAKAAPIRDDSGKVVSAIVVFIDITDHKLAEAEKTTLQGQLYQAQKLESIGQLAGGVAHDFNNILAVFMMHLSYLKDNPHLDQETHESLQELMFQAKRAASLTRQLLLFSRRSTMEVNVLDLNELVVNLLKMLTRLIGEHITMRFDRDEGLPAIEADPGMIEQILMNLAVNARDAMPKGGTLTIKTEAIRIDADRLKATPSVQPGIFLCLSVTDTGCGMDEATLKRIFEPFFTTKEVGKGTGLGLATVHGIAVQHKGWVEVQSQPGQGSTFKVFLPTTSKEIAATTQIGNYVLSRGHETILLVEDEECVRRLVSRTLLRLGYQIMEAPDGPAALNIWREHSEKIDLLYSDMIMPGGLNGLDLAEKMRATKPSLKVIISSGYNSELEERGSRAAEGFVYIQKPFSIQAISQTIRNCFDKK